MEKKSYYLFHLLYAYIAFQIDFSTAQKKLTVEKKLHCEYRSILIDTVNIVFHRPNLWRN